MRINHKSIIYLIFLFLTLPCYAERQLTAEEVAQKAASVLTSTQGLQADFTLKSNGRSGKGAIKSSGNKFMVEIPGAISWYNGKDLYTYNAKSAETTVVTPTARELLEVNPLLYVKNSGGNYNYNFSTVKRNGKYIIDLTPKKKSEIKKLAFTINSSNYNIERISVTTSGGVTEIIIDTFKNGVSLSANDFEYPKNKYPKAEIIDLR